MSLRRVALSTMDNPYDPFEQFILWFLFDEEHGYHSCSYLGRIVNSYTDSTDEENNEEIERAIDEIIRNDFLGIYKKVVEPSPAT